MQNDVLMAVRHYRDLIAWQLASEFKREAIRLLKSSHEAWSNLKYRHQLLDAANAVPSDLAEGFLRASPAQFCIFIDHGLGSLGEAENRLQDGIDVGYFPAADCEPAFRLARRCLTACVRLKQSQQRYIKEKKKKDGKR